MNQFLIDNEKSRDSDEEAQLSEEEPAYKIFYDREEIKQTYIN